MGAPHVWGMREFEGRTGVVLEIAETEYNVKMDCDPHHRWRWLKRAVEPVSEETAPKTTWRIIIEGDENTSRAKYIVDKKVINEVSAKRYHKDKHDPAMAARALMAKMFSDTAKPDDPPKYFTGKAVCVRPSEFTTLEKGRIYDFSLNDGRGDDRIGGLILCSPAKDIEEINRRLDSEFIEIKED
jgi:hypothetical protein